MRSTDEVRAGQVPLRSGPTAAGPAVNLTRRPLLRRLLLGAAIIVLFIVSALLLSVAIGVEVGGQAALLGVLFAVLPVGIVVPALMWLDRFEAEPIRYLLFAFGWGALVATTVSIVLNTGSLIVLSNVGIDAEAVGAVMIAPVVEESLKGLAVLLILWFRRSEFDGVIDGIVYAGVTAAGFAFAENILYLGRAYAEMGAQGLVGLFVIRGLIGPFAHPLFTMWTGVGVGIAATRTRGALRWTAPIGGLLVAMLLHGLWNLAAVAGIEGFWSSYLLLQVPIFLGALAFVSWQRRREGRLIGASLAIYADYGWLSAAEVEMLGSLRARKEARRWAARVGGRRAKRAMIAFQDDASGLALLRVRMSHGSAGPEAPALERQLLHTMTRCRAALP
ncbi:MAG: PrsW family intramembrane metalloprotease [Micrococcales bacterium]|nr:PrsW family intramembrane metalloprotease [Micrococcales bacterium]